MQASRSRVSMDDSSGSMTEFGILGGAKDRFAAHLSGTCHGGRSLSARQHINDECRDAPGED
ncbi:hypothetical protein PIB30_082133 [Stylosanthes scabra]|uniref:Uncharacterized protein n=1 Tax=Stylosanthes scabra TaxID=79078 RepID=A0ABU6TSJ9_9FABA|nr:hypothetical protein [Stylosanthes scabra]